jgi:hypothetical protein
VRISREALIDLARDEAVQRAATNNVLSAYLIGSVASGDPLLGGAADIDLILIHAEQPVERREIVPLSDDVHLDIEHHARAMYARPRTLRTHPWMGPAMCEPIFLYDPEHLFEWAQAAARGQYYRPDHMLNRARAFLQRARQARSVLSISNRWLKTYTRAVLEAANALACLSGFPVAGRRLVRELETCLDELGQPQVYQQFLNLLGASAIDSWDLPTRLSAWGRAFDDAATASPDPDLAPCRRRYYHAGLQAFAEESRPEATIYTLLTTWENAIYALASAGHLDSHAAAWQAFVMDLELHEGAYAARGEALEKFIDEVEAHIEAWADASGA